MTSNKAKELFNSRGEHIAFVLHDELHRLTGENCGHYVPDKAVFIDMKGKYQGEIFKEKYLLRNNVSPFAKAAGMGKPGYAGNIGKPGKFSDIAPIALPDGWTDVSL